MIYFLAVLSPAIAVAFRRLHDTGRSGWWWLLSLVPIIGQIVVLVCYATDGDAGDNKRPGARPGTNQLRLPRAGISA